MSKPAPADVISRLATLICTNLAAQPPLLATAIWYETCQGSPTVYLCYETAEHSLAQFCVAAEPEAYQKSIDSMQRVLNEGPPHIGRKLRGDQLGWLFDPGYWANPADPVLHGVDPVVDAWLEKIFGNHHALVMAGEPSGAARAEIRTGLWAALDAARRSFTGAWPPVSFVKSSDDYQEDILTYMTTRADDGS